LVKSGSAIDALAACKTIALDKTGTITTGSLNLAEGFVIGGCAGSNGGSIGTPVQIREMLGLGELAKRVAGGGDGPHLGTVTAFGGGGGTRSAAALDSDDYSLSTLLDDASAGAAATAGGLGSSSGPGFDTVALKCAVALSRLSNHPVSRAMVDSAPHMDGDVSVLSFEQVREALRLGRGFAVLGYCLIGRQQLIS
jgi:magnesium-transporting ATPase (P-type)